MEKRDLYDIHRRLTGESIYKGEQIPQGKYINVVLSFMQNSKGDFLIQKRSLRKNGKFASTGGHPKSGETSLQGMMTEIKEEIGLIVHPSELNLLYSDRDDNDQIFLDIYYMKKDFNICDLILQREEVESVFWLSKQEIETLIDNKLFFDSHAFCFHKMLEITKN